MSWHVAIVGSPDAIIKALEGYSLTLSGQSAIEFSSALPHLCGLLRENFGSGSMLKLEASGSGVADIGRPGEKPFDVAVQQSRCLQVELKHFYCVLAS